LQLEHRCARRPHERRRREQRRRTARGLQGRPRGAL